MSPAPVAEKKVTKASWVASAKHPVQLPSGTVVFIRLPNLSLMLKTGQVPNLLVETAVEQANLAQSGGTPTITRELIESQWDYTAWIVAQTVVEPAITVDDVADLPPEDLDMLVEFANRQRDLDAAYNHIGGLEKQESFRRFRRIPDSDAGLDGL